MLSCKEVSAQNSKIKTITTNESLASAYEQYEHSNQQVAEAYTAVNSYLESFSTEQAYHQKNILHTAQLSWMNYRGNHCQLISGKQQQNAGGPGDAYYRCIAEINRQRLAELRALLTNLKREYSGTKAQ